VKKELLRQIIKIPKKGENLVFEPTLLFFGGAVSSTLVQNASAKNTGLLPNPDPSSRVSAW
jgi:hypothetical protein